MGTMIEVETLAHDGRFQAYLAKPEGAARAAIVVVQEIFGVNPGIRAKCDALAKMGYLAIAPDLFCRVQPGVQLDPDEPEQFKQALAIMRQFDTDIGIRDIEATIRAARAQGAAKVGIVGYCLGGKLAFLAATRTDVQASVGYYGGQIDQFLGEAHAIAHPVLLHFAGDDHFIPAEARAKIHDALAGNHHVTIHDYPGVDHGFATEHGARREPEAAGQADARTAAFFAAHL